MRPCANVNEYRAAPVGRFVTGRGFLHFFAARDFCGLVLWGRPDEDDVRAMCGAIDAELPEHSAPHASIVDARRLTGVDPTAFELLVDYFRCRSVALGDNNFAHALVRPLGVPGAVVAGFWDVAPARHPDRVRVFEDAAQALEWLGRRDMTAADLDALHAGATTAPRALQALRDQLAARPARARLAEVARQLGMSGRALQEHLKAAGTTYRDEVAAARVRAAQALMVETDRKLGAIALDVGCASLQHFSTLFRKATGEAPSAWRSRARAATRPR